MLSVKTILFVENDLVSQSLYQKRLEREGFHVECAPDGQVALNILSERAPDLILLDLMLPKVSGADVLKFVHADPRLTTIPVIIFSNAPMTEVPPDDPLAQGTRRLLKSDCPFPMLLSTIQEALAQTPEFVVIEAGKMPAAPSLVANGNGRRNGAVAVASSRPETERALEKRRSEFLEEAAVMMPKIREQSMGYIKAPNSGASRAHLSGLHKRVHLLNSSVDQAGCPRVALLTNAFDALLCGIMDKPATITPSVLQTIAQAVDCLDGLLKNSDGYSTGPSFQAKVLVVDDDTVCNHVNVSSLKRASFDAVGVKEPVAAVKMLETTPFDLVVLDINMPGLTGFDVCQKIRRFPHCKNTPVIFVTAFNDFDNRKQSVLSGGNDFVSKPVSPLELGLKVAINLIKARVKGSNADASQLETDSAANNGSADKPQSASSTRTNLRAWGETQSPEPSNRLSPEIKLPLQEDKKTTPLRMVRPESESRSKTPPEPNRQSKMQTPTIQSGSGTTQNGDIQERLRETSAALKHAKADLEQESVERSRFESHWREQLNGAEALVQQAENVIKEKEAHRSRLEKELAESQKAKDELQTRFAAEQQSAAKAQQELSELKANLEKLSAERARVESEVRGQLDATKAAVTQKETLLKEKETRCGQLEKELSGLQQVRDELQTKLAAEQQTSAKSQQTVNELQERLRQGNEELKRVSAELERQSAERKRLETEWREQLNAAKTTASQTEARLVEKTNRCGQLEKELSGLQRVRDELQTKLAAEQQTSAKSQQTVNDLQERLRQGKEELGRVNAEREKQSAEQKRLEADWHQQLTAAKAAATQTEAMLAEKAARCGQLEKEMVGVQQTRDEFQKQFAAEQNKAAQLQREIEKFQQLLHQRSSEVERAQTALDQESARRTHLESECHNLNRAREAINLELNNLRESRTADEAKLRDKQKNLAKGLRENIQHLQLRLQEVESLDGTAAEASEAKLQMR